MSKLWEVDPETRSKLLDVQKVNGNNVCVDCSAPHPAWASPKFGIFMCLNCSGIHRGLGVHITFIRSVTMDSFKVSEIKRMQLGGNQPWQEFFNNHKDNQLESKTFEDATIKERYDSEVGEEWKERLSAKVEGIEYVRSAKAASARSRSQSQTPISKSVNESSASSTPLRSSSPAVGQGLGPSRKTQNEAYFAQKGVENAARPEYLPPSQGGRFAGFGSELPPTQSHGEADWLGEMSRDPLAGLTKGFGWLGKSAKTVYDDSIKPNVQKLAESDFTSQARLTAAQVAANLQSTSKTATQSLSRFVEGASPPISPGPMVEKADFWNSFGAAPKGPDNDKKAFWDAFADAGAAKASAVGTSAMKTKKKDDDEWGW